MLTWQYWISQRWRQSDLWDRRSYNYEHLITFTLYVQSPLCNSYFLLLNVVGKLPGYFQWPHTIGTTFMPHTISQSNLWYFCSYIYEFLAPHVLILRSDILWKHYLWVGHMVQNLKMLIFFKTKLKSEDISRGRQLWERAFMLSLPPGCGVRVQLFLSSISDRRWD